MTEGDSRLPPSTLEEEPDALRNSTGAPPFSHRGPEDALPSSPSTLREIYHAIHRDIEQWTKYSSDFSGSHLSWLRRISVFFLPSLQCCLLYRLSHWLHRLGWIGLSRCLWRINYLVHKCDISPGARIGEGLYIPHTVGVIFHGHAGERTTLYARSIVVSTQPHTDKTDVYDDCPLLGDNVTVGVCSVVQGAIHLAHGTFVGANVVLLADSPPNALYLHNNQSETRARTDLGKDTP
ncbi:MAG: hypothetical protein U1D30_19055 [Planctomycetota bacterium]